MDDEKNKNEQNNETPKIVIPVGKKLLKHVILIILLIFFLCWLVTNPAQVGTVILKILSILMPFIFGLCLAFVANVILVNLEKLWKKITKKSKGKWADKTKRPVCLVFTYIIIFGIVVAVVFMVIPTLIDTVRQIVDSIPTYLKNLQAWWETVIDFFAQYNITIPRLEIDFDKIINIVTNFMTQYGNSLVQHTITITSSIVTTTIKLILGFAVSLYVLSTKERLGRQTTMALKALTKEKTSDKVLYLASETYGSFYRFITGQVIEACIIGCLCFIGMLIFKMPFAGMISILIGVTSLVPIFGAIFGTIIGAFFILLVSPIQALWFVVFIVVLQQFESNLIYPKVVGTKVGLPGLWVLFSVTIGGGLLGVFGMLISVPICSVLYCLFREFVYKRIKEKEMKKMAEDVEESEDLPHDDAAAEEKGEKEEKDLDNKESDKKDEDNSSDQPKKSKTLSQLFKIKKK